MAIPVVPSSLEQQVEVETPEQVVISYTVAGIGSRAAAALIDYLICVVAIVVLGWLAALVAPARGSHSGASPSARSSVSWALAIITLVLFCVFWGYYVVFEALWDGQTPGKRRLGIRVVQDGGYSISIAASAVRNLMRILDMQPGILYGVGMVSAAVSSSGKRLGDYLAGTFVVRERVHAIPAATPQGGARDEPVAVTAALSESEFELLDRFIERRAALDEDRRRAIADQLGERFGSRLPADGGSTQARLLHLHQAERAARARGAAARGDTGAARERQAIVTQGATRWSAFATMLQHAQRGGLRALSEREVSEFVASYREVSTDLARLQTAAGGREMDSLFYVSRLVGAGHNLLYRQRRVTPRAAWRYLTVTVPRELRRSALPIGIAAGLLFVPAIISALAVYRHPDLAVDLLPAGMLDRAEEGVQRARTDSGYISVRPADRPLMVSAIIGNNITVTYATFAYGATAGVGTVLALVYNGVAALGAAVGLYASMGILTLILAFVIPHSVLELTAICVAGGGGLLIGSAMLLPGAMTRREALVVRGRRAIRLIAAATLMLVMAGTIEGLISPRVDIPIAVKIGIAAASAIFLVVYWSLGRGAGGEEVAEQFGYSDARALISK